MSNSKESLFKLCSNEIEGRYLVASRDIKAGELILDEEPMTRCPPYSTPPICLGCYVLLEKHHFKACPQCNWPMCSEKCCLSADHLQECDLFKAANYKVNPDEFNFETFEPLYDVLTPLRVLSLREKSPEKWKEFSQLMSHMDDWMQSRTWIEEHQPASDFILSMKLKGVDQALIWRIFGICYTNEFSAKVRDCRVRMTYAKVAMLSHDCWPNVTRYICGIRQKNRIKCLASKDIAAGEKLSITYVDLILPGLIRRDILRKSKHFECKCERCEDPSEFGTHGSSFMCQKCQTGSQSYPEWICTNCKEKRDKKLTEQMTFDIYEESEALIKDKANWSVVAYEKFLLKYGKILHPSNLLLARIKQNLASFYGRLDGYQMQDLAFNPMLLERKLCITRECLDVVDKIETSISSIKGVLLYELHMPLIVKAQTELTSGKIDEVKARKQFKKAVKCLKNSLEHLKYEPEGSFENQLYVAGHESLGQLKNLLQ